jgi:hypothetical protein
MRRVMVYNDTRTRVQADHGMLAIPRRGTRWSGDGGSVRTVRQVRDEETRRLVPLFNPRRHKWDRHFRWRGVILVGRTPIGRGTVALLKIYDPLRLELRENLLVEGLFQP